MALLRRIIRDMFGTRSAPDAAEPEDTGQSPLRVFIERDSRAPQQYHTLCESLLYGASVPLAITALSRRLLPIERAEPRPLEFGRLLVPWLCGYRGWALFLESDMLAIGDVAQLFELADDRYAVMQARSSEAGEWNSLLLFNCAHPANRMLDPEFLNAPDSLRSADLLFWLDEELIGALPLQWNHTVAFDLPNDDAQLVHYPVGVPWHVETEGCEWSEPWWDAHVRSSMSCTWVELYGPTYHSATAQNGRLVPFAVQHPGAGLGRSLSPPPESLSCPAPPPLGPRSQAALVRSAAALAAAKDAVPVDGLVAHREQLGKLCHRTSSATLLDYGAGPVTDDDDTTAVLAGEWRLRSLRRFEPAWPGSAARPEEVFDGVACIRVLEHVPIEDVDHVLADIFGFAARFVLLSVGCVRERDHAAADEVNPLQTPFWWRHRVMRARRVRPGALFLMLCELDDGETIVFEG